MPSLLFTTLIPILASDQSAEKHIAVSVTFYLWKNNRLKKSREQIPSANLRTGLLLNKQSYYHPLLLFMTFIPYLASDQMREAHFSSSYVLCCKTIVLLSKWDPLFMRAHSAKVIYRVSASPFSITKEIGVSGLADPETNKRTYIMYLPCWTMSHLGCIHNAEDVFCCPRTSGLK